MQDVEYADGTVRRELVFRGQIKFGDRKHRVEITLTEAADALVGTRLLQDSVLEIDFSNLTVEIKQD